MVDTTPKISLKKPEPNVDTNWGVTLNQSLDILDDAVLAANTTGKGTVTVTDDGSGNVTISGTDTGGGGGGGNDVSNAMVGSDGITVTSGVSTDTISGFYGEFTTASGSLQAAIDAVEASGLQNVVEDTTPELGGDLDASGFSISNVNDVTATGSIQLTEGHIELSQDASSGGQFIGASDQATPMLTTANNLDSGISISDTHVKIWEKGDLCITFNGTDIVTLDKIRLINGSTKTAPALYFNQGDEAGVHSTLDNGNEGWGWHIDNIEIGYWDINKDLYVVNSLHVGGTVSGTDLIVVDTLTAPSGIFSDSLTVSGIPVSLASTEGSADRFLAGDGTLDEAAYGFASRQGTPGEGTGMFLNGPNDLQFIQNGVTFLRFTTGRFIPAFAVYVDVGGSPTFPTHSWLGDRNSGMYQNVSGDNSVAFATNATRAGYFDFQQHLHVTNDVLSGGTVSGTEGTFDDGLTVSGVPVATGTVVDEGQIVFLAQMFG